MIGIRKTHLARALVGLGIIFSVVGPAFSAGLGSSASASPPRDPRRPWTAACFS